MKKLLVISSLCAVIMLIITNCSDKKPEAASSSKLTDLQTKARAIFGTLPNLVNDSLNPVTPEKAALGQALYYDPILSKNRTQSCNTCHDISTFGVDNNSFSKGDAPGKIGGRNAPTTLNVALHVAQFWDGRAKTVEDQAGGPVLNPIEMGMPSEQAVVDRLKASPVYVEMFKKAFPNQPDAITWENLRKAIGAFERELVTPSRFDKYLAGDDDALTYREKQGLQDFMNTGCIACHNGTAIGGGTFQKFGVYEDYWKETKSAKQDNGVADVSKDTAQKNFFKVPSLRNIAKTYPYFHDGSVRNLKDAVRIMGKVQLDKQLTPAQVEDITVFFDALTGDVDTAYMKDTHPVVAAAK